MHDISSRAKTGIKVGDIQREAHMAFCMATISEENKSFLQAIKFYKRLYFCAKLLDDHEGSEISLNKIAICFYKVNNFQKSLSFHIKHQELAEKMKDNS